MYDAGTYALIILSTKQLHLQIGKLGTYDFPSGYYIYVGSALSGLDSRLKRHMSSDKSLHWHIDYLLQQTKLVQIWYTLSKNRLECIWNAILGEVPGVIPFIRGFGSSDCSCRTHLNYFSTPPSFNSFRKELTNQGLQRLHQLTI